ncbi:bifunctional folylpolyglutamate synthase/dihydrofolate synthase [Candidatus Viridilinea mediisalina]|uniref:tetrahydrofolate synthase n=1 Tax=Candidatus Viridilinea mediisalina TaxID=2024553 RepID=A0A2A6RDH7_9CHLR|nr:cyanophycin synthetase [Candidatus Viridilinea mediisalina]PDV99144.1 bifunctional folylpolyglutamate synthase/dihydrofolate synthase [Candidatus Viridilinea mediisalina]
MSYFPTYQAALDYLYRFVDPTRKPAATHDAAANNLRRMAALLEAAGQPQAGLRCVVVAGTKGKGSTAALIESLARAAGLRVGLFTSPHLSSYRERIQVDRCLITQAELMAQLAALCPLLDGFDPTPYGRPTTFDLGLLMALQHFAACRVDVAVLEIGLGGRFDAVNVITPLVAAISSISYDHRAVLGASLAEIAWNKAGIIKPGVPVVTVPQAAEALPLIEAEAQRMGAPLWHATPQGLCSAHGETSAYPVVPQSALRGAVQQENARLALGVALLLRRAGLALPNAALAEGLANVTWPARFELVAGTPPILIDGAHNGDSAAKLLADLRSEIAYERMILLLGTSRDKDIAAIAAALVPAAAGLVLTRSLHPRAMDLDRIAAVVSPLLNGPLVMNPDVATALATAQGMAGPRDLIVVTGSLFVAAAAREALGLAVAE